MSIARTAATVAFSAFALGAPITASAAPEPVGLTYGLLQAQQDPQPQTQTTTTIERTVWYTNPVWIVVGLLGAALIIGLLVAASRSGNGSTTVVR